MGSAGSAEAKSRDVRRASFLGEHLHGTYACLPYLLPLNPGNAGSCVVAEFDEGTLMCQGESSSGLGDTVFASRFRAHEMAPPRLLSAQQNMKGRHYFCTKGAMVCRV